MSTTPDSAMRLRDMMSSILANDHQRLDFDRRAKNLTLKHHLNIDPKELMNDFWLWLMTPRGMRLGTRCLDYPEADAERMLIRLAHEALSWMAMRHVQIRTREKSNVALMNARHGAAMCASSSSASPVETAVKHEQMEMCREAMRTVLTPAERRMLAMVFMEGMSRKVVAAKMGMSEPALRTKLCRAMQKIRHYVAIA